MVRGFQTLAASGERYEPATMLTLELEISENKYREGYQQAAFYRQVLERTSAIPGVRSAVAASSMPYNGQPPWRVFTIEGKPPEPGDLPSGGYQAVSVNYFETMHIPLLAGRLLSAADGANSSPRGGDQRAHGAALVAGRAAARRQAHSDRRSGGGRTMAHHRGSGGQRAAKRFRPRTGRHGLRPLRAGAQDRHGYWRPRRARRAPRSPAPGAGGHGGHPLGGRRAAHHLGRHPGSAAARRSPGHRLRGRVDGRFRPAGAGAFLHRGVWRDGLPGFRADPRNRHPHGPGSAARKRARHGFPPRDADRGYRAWRRVWPRPMRSPG